MAFKSLKVFKIFEITLVFIGLPLLYYFNFIPFHKSIPLFLVFTIFLILLLKDKDFNRSRFGFNGFKNWKPLIIRFLIIAILSILIVWRFFNDSFFNLPTKSTGLWILIMILYPLWSAFPQELIYRTWFFHRYKILFRNEKVIIFLNALLFSFSHIIFRNGIAIILSFFGGLMFAYTYRKSQSLLVVFIEHMLYGNLIFTIGLGQFFYLPLSK